MRIVLLSGVLLATASCAWAPPPDAVTAPAPPPPIALAVPAPPPVAVVTPPPPVAVAAPAPFPFVSPAWFSGTPPSGRLTLNNFTYADAHVEAVVTSAPDCSAPPGVAATDFVLPLNGTRIIEAPPGADVCWRRAITPDTARGRAASAPAWTEWNRAFVSSGRSIDSQL